MKKETFEVIENHNALTLISKLDGKYYPVTTKEELEYFGDTFLLLKTYFETKKKVFCNYLKYDSRFPYFNGDGFLLLKKEREKVILYVLLPDILVS